MSATTRRRYRRVLIGLTLIVILSLVLAECASRSKRTNDGWGVGVGAAPVDRSPAGFTIHGSLMVPLVPGLSAPLDLVIHNHGNEDLLIHGLEVEVVSVDAPKATAELPCSPGDFRVRQGRGQLVVAAGQARTLSESGWREADQPTVTMRDTSLKQDGCKSAGVTLDYRAVGSTP